MASQYLDLATQSINQAMNLTDEQKKIVANLELKLSVLNDSVKLALSKIDKDVADKVLTEENAILERAGVEASALKTRKISVAQIQSIYPAWADTLGDAFKKGAEKTAQGVEFSAEKSGEVLGNLIQVPVSSAIKFWDNLKLNARKRVG
jgi:Na+-transporting NADH:ubiquinone oxidoreductase subunit NqrC